MWNSDIYFIHSPSIFSADLNQSAVATEGFWLKKKTPNTQIKILIHINILTFTVLLVSLLQDRALCAVCVHSFRRTPGWVYIVQYGLEHNNFAAMMKMPSVIPTFTTPARLGCFQSPLEWNAWSHGGDRQIEALKSDWRPNAQRQSVAKRGNRTVFI